MTNREAHEEAAGMGLEDAFFRFNKIDPDAPASPTPEQALKDAIQCLERFGIRLAVEAKSTATNSLRAKQCEIRSSAIFTVLDALVRKGGV